MSSEEYFEGYRNGVEDTVLHYRAMFKTQFVMVYLDHLSGQWKWAGNWSSKDDVRCLIEGSEEMLESMRQL